MDLSVEAGSYEALQLQGSNYGIQSRLWGWNRSSNVLFIDQSTQASFSDDFLKNSTMDIYDGTRSNRPTSGCPSPWLQLNGTFSTGHDSSAQNTKLTAASASSHLLQSCLPTFPNYIQGTHPNGSLMEPTCINLLAESYRGNYGPAFADFESQTSKRNNGKVSRNSALGTKLNTRGVQALNQTTELNILGDFQSPDEWEEHAHKYRDSIEQDNSFGEGDKSTTSMLCHAVFEAQVKLLHRAIRGGTSPYDICTTLPYSYPNSAYLEYLNSVDVQRSIGAKVNLTQLNNAVSKIFTESEITSPNFFWLQANIVIAGGPNRSTRLSSLASPLNMGVRVAFMHGHAWV